jgi:LPS-assembly lipoprotein
MMSYLKLFILTLGLLTPLTSCGFTPVYQKTEQNLSALELMNATLVSAPKTKRGQMLQYAVQDRLTPKGESYNPRFRLHSDLIVQEQPVIVEQSGEIRRYRVMVSAPFTLVRLQDGEPVYSGKIYRSVNYNISDNDYSTYVSSENAVSDAIREMAKDFEKRLASFFSRYDDAS